MLRHRELQLPWLAIAGAALLLAAPGRAQEEQAEPAAEGQPASDEETPKPKPKPKAKAVETPKTEESGEGTAAEEEAPKKRQPTPEAPALAPEKKADQKARTVDSDDLATVARAFFTKLLKRDPDGASAYCKPPFYFEGKAANNPDDVRRRWAAALNSRPVERFTLYGIDVMTPEEMEAKYGKPPEKLSGWPMRGGMITVANLSGQAAVVLWKKNGTTWSAVAYHD